VYSHPRTAQRKRTDKEASDVLPAAGDAARTAGPAGMLVSGCRSGPQLVEGDSRSGDMRGLDQLARPVGQGGQIGLRAPEAWDLNALPQKRRRGIWKAT